MTSASLGRKPGLTLGNLTTQLPHLDIVDGVVFLENGKVEVGLELSLPSVLFASVDRVEADWRAMRSVLQLALPFDARARFYLEAAPDRGERLREYAESIRSPYPLVSAVMEAKVRHLEQERARQRVLSWKAFLTISIPVRPKGKMQLTQAELEEVLLRARSLQERVANFLKAGGSFGARPLDSQEVFDLLWRWLNPNLSSSPAPRYQSLLKNGLPLVPGKVAKEFGNWHQMTARAQAVGSIVENYSDQFLLVGGKFLDGVVLYSPPDETFMGMLSRVLNNIPGTQLYLVVEYLHEPAEPVIAKLQADARKYTALAEGEGMRDLTAKGKLKEVEKAVEALVETGDHIYQSSVAVVFSADNLDDLRILRERVISAMSVFVGARPTYGAGLPMRLYFDLAPFNGEVSPHTFKVPTTNAADFAPTSLPWGGQNNPTAIYRNRFSGLTSINAYDPSAPNWNGLVVAGSGSGKTFFMQSYLTSLLAQGDAEVIIVDRGGGYIPLVEALAGKEVIIPIEPGQVSINPFDLPEGTHTPSEDKKGMLFGILRSMVPPSDDPEVAAVEDAILISAIDQVYKRRTEERKDPITGEYVPVFLGAGISDLIAVLLRLDDIGGRAATPRDKMVAQALATRFQTWAGNTPYGSFVDRPTNIRTDYPIIYFETTGLDRYPALQGPGILLLADIIWRRAEKDPRIRKLVVMDEVWAMLTIPQAQRLVVELYRRARRYNTAIYSVSQSLADFTQIRGIVQNTTYFFLGKIPATEYPLIKEVLGAPPTVQEAMASLRMVRGEYSEFLTYVNLGTQAQGEIIRVEPSKLEYWIYTTNPSDMARRNQLAQERGISILEAARILAGKE